MPSLQRLSTLCLLPGALAQACSLLGPVYPAPDGLLSSEAFLVSKATLLQVLKDGIKTGQTDYGPLEGVNTTFSVGVFSARDPDLLFEFHHQATGALAPKPGPTLNGKSVYRVASVTKVLTILTILARLGGKVPWEDSITKYVPELRKAPKGDVVENVQWDDVSLGALASHLSGVARDYALLDMSADPNTPLPLLGFPVLNDTERTPCGTFGLKPCSRDDSFKLLLNHHHPITAPGTTPIYSNTAYGLLGIALENITGEPFETSFVDAVLKPLNLKRASWQAAPQDPNIVVPGGDVKGSWWDYDLAQDTPAGGAYLSLSSLSSIGRAILSSALMPASATRAWLKPSSHSASLFGSVGKGWEIVRVELPVASANTTAPGAQPARVVDLYTKAGGTGAYGSVIMLSPDHGVGFAVLSAGPLPGFPGVVPVLGEALLGTVLPALEIAARTEAGRQYGGRYSSSGHAVSVELAPQKPGLALTKWDFNGTDVLGIFGVDTIQLYPVGLESEKIAGSRKVAFRGVMVPKLPQGPPGQERRPTKPPQYLHPCSTTWLQVDTMRYGGVALDEFVFETGETGRALALDIPALRGAALKRVT